VPVCKTAGTRQQEQQGQQEQLELSEQHAGSRCIHQCMMMSPSMTKHSSQTGQKVQVQRIIQPSAELSAGWLGLAAQQASQSATRQIKPATYWPY
jgi:hypothetical protein